MLLLSANVYQISVSSYEANWRTLYAFTGNGPSDDFYCILKPMDGGFIWDVTRTFVGNEPSKQIFGGKKDIAGN